MQIKDLLCYAVLTITVTSTVAKVEPGPYRPLGRPRSKVARRETSLLLDSTFPIEPSTAYNEPKVVYRRVARHPYRKPKPKYGPPRAKYGPPRSKYGPAMRGKGKRMVYKYGPPSYKKRPMKSRFPSKHKPKPIYGNPMKRPSYYSPEPTGFGEPPNDFGGPYPLREQALGDAPVDSYGAPLMTPGDSLYSPSDIAFESAQKFRPTYKDPKLQVWEEMGEPEEEETIDLKPHTKRPYTTIKAQHLAAMPSHNLEYEENFDLNSYSDVFNYGKKLGNPKQKLRMKGRKKPIKEPEVVGGQYAEPPARYFPKFQHKAPTYSDDEEDPFSQSKTFEDSDAEGSESISSYVNYKNSNMAFSPQNLNDAFSIVDK